MMKHALARMFHELPAATADMAVLPGVLGCRTLRRIPRSAGWHAHLHGLATAIHKTSRLEECSLPLADFAIVAYGYEG